MSRQFPAVVNDHNKTEQSMENELETQVDAVYAPEPEQTQSEMMAETLAGIRERDKEVIDPAATPVAKADKPRATDGKYAKETDEQKAAKVAAPPAQPADAPAAATDPAAPQIQATRVQAPTSYSPAGKAEFDKAAPAIQQEILKREGDFHKYYQTTQQQIEPIKQSANFGNEVAQALRPFEQTMRGLGASPVQAIQGLFAADHKLRYGAPQEKLQAFAELAKGYGIDLSQGLPTQQQVDPNVEYLQRQNHQAMQTAQQAQQEILQMKQAFARQNEAAEQSQLNSVIEQARQGKPHFDELRQEIGMILQSSLNRANQTGEGPMTLDQAYEAALWQSPKHRVELLAKQREDELATAAQKRAEDAEKAKLAKKASSVNVQKRGTMPAQAPVGSNQDFMRAKLDEIRSR
ncbi:MAG TPA: hypothetical protein DEQ40_02470 [Oxalobacteraceae bacterium]|jgi:hypothetical protein|nr:hypothetical protein [Oxalobacteraceae bacterium]